QDVEGMDRRYVPAFDGCSHGAVLPKRWRIPGGMCQGILRMGVHDHVYASGDACRVCGPGGFPANRASATWGRPAEHRVGRIDVGRGYAPGEFGPPTCGCIADEAWLT